MRLSLYVMVAHHKMDTYTTEQVAVRWNSHYGSDMKVILGKQRLQQGLCCKMSMRHWKSFSVTGSDIFFPNSFMSTGSSSGKCKQFYLIYLLILACEEFIDHICGVSVAD